MTTRSWISSARGVSSKVAGVRRRELGADETMEDASSISVDVTEAVSVRVGDKEIIEAAGPRSDWRVAVERLLGRVDVDVYMRRDRLKRAIAVEYPSSSEQS
jgi:hypothetical protein